MTAAERLTRDYRAAFLRYLPRRDEAALTAGYEIGRRAMVEGISVLEVAMVHHQVLLEVIDDSPHEQLAHAARAASEFVLEVLAPYDMFQRAARERGRDR